MGSAWENAICSAILILSAVGVGWFAKDTYCEMWRDGAIEKLLCAFQFILLGVLVIVGVAKGNEAYIRFTTNTVVETITLTSTKEELVLVPVIHRVGQVTFVQQIPTRHTDVTCQEYPGKVFRATGSKSWSAGDKVNITFYIRGGERITYDL